MHGANSLLVRYQNRNTGQFRTTTQALGLDWNRIESVGWIFANQMVAPDELNTVRLVGWSNAADTRFLLLRVDQSPPAEYVHSRTEGWGIAPLD
jgi:hypothetical protein